MIQLSPEMLAHCYDYLCHCVPFNKMNMPHSEDVKFLVVRNKDRFAHYQMVNDIHHIAVSTHLVGRHMSLLSTMAHEMCHLYLRANKIQQKHAHGRAFQRLADQVCAANHEFDRLNF